ncbi:MAG: LysE family translocator [Candidatus Binatia bacterium]
MSLEAWLLFCATETVLSFTPGPAVLLVVSVALTRGSGAGFRSSLGILAANALYFTISATSLGAILLASSQLFFVVKWLGAAYLVWLGVRMVFRNGADAPRAAASPPQQVGVGPLACGFLTQGANPKALVFFSAILPQFIDPAGSVPLQVAILGVSSVLIELGVLGIYVIACAHAGSWARRPQYAAPLERLGGVLLIAAGLRLAAVRRA